MSEDDLIDDNIELLLEDCRNDPNQAYIYIRVQCRPDGQKLLVESDNSLGFTANTDRVSVLTNGTLTQFAVSFLELFELDSVFMEAFIAAINAVDAQKSSEN